MAVRIRENGRVFCAALNPARKGDLYIDDSLHYHLSVVAKVLVTEPNEGHMAHKGEWWWRGKEPIGIDIDKFYNEA